MIEKLEVKFPAYTPGYILNEIERYLWKIENGITGLIVFDNILTLINLAICNGRINKQQAENIIVILNKITDIKLNKK